MWSISGDEPLPRQPLSYELPGSLARVWLVIICEVHPKPFWGRGSAQQNKQAVKFEGRLELADLARERLGSFNTPFFLLPSPVKAAYLELQAVRKKHGVIYFIILCQSKIVP